MSWLKRAMSRHSKWIAYIRMQSKLKLNEDHDVPLNQSSWLTKQWDDGTGKLSNNHNRLGSKENIRLGYTYKKLD